MKLAHGAEIAPGLKLVEPIGNGAMGSVWVADWDQRAERVAVKLIPERIARVKGMVERFRREAEVARRIQSHHVVSIYDLGQTVSGLPYIVMEKLDGETLEDRLERDGRVTVPFAVRFVPQLGAALSAAHDVNVMHRDIKPTNLFLIGEGEAPQLKVLDFGAAKEVRVKGGSIVTATGVAIGSPFMMSPEQVLGSRFVDHRTDLWSFAVVVYRMLCGQLPFVADNPSALAFTICQAKYIKPSELGAPEALDLWFVRALQPQKERRFGSGREMAAEFLDLLGEQPLSLIEDESTFDNATTGVFRGAATFARSHMPDPTGADDSPESVTLTGSDDATLNRENEEILAALRGAPGAQPAARKPQNTLKGHPPPPVRAAREEAARAKAARSADLLPALSSSSVGDHGGREDSGAGSSAPSELVEVTQEPPDFPAPSVPPPPSDPEASLPQADSPPATETALSVSPSAVSSKPPATTAAKRAPSASSSRYAWIGLGVLAAVAVGVFALRQSGGPATVASESAPVAESAPVVTTEPEPAVPAPEPAPADVSSATPSASAVAEDPPAEDSGQLSIICVPVCSDVLVDGTSWGPSPIDKRSVSAGFHSIMLFRAGMTAKPTTVKIEAGEHKEKKVFFEVGKPPAIPASAPPPVSSAKPPPVPTPEPPPPSVEPAPKVDPAPAPVPVPEPPPASAPAPPPASPPAGGSGSTGGLRMYEAASGPEVVAGRLDISWDHRASASQEQGF